MNENNVRILVSYTDTKTQQEKNTFGNVSILPLNNFSEIEMGPVLAKQLAIHHAGHEAISILNFKIERL